MNPLGDMPTHVLNDINVAGWLVFFAAWVIITPIMQVAKHTRPRNWRKVRRNHG